VGQWSATVLRWDQKNKACEIFRVVLDIGGEDDAAVVFGGATSGDGGSGLVTTGENFADAASSVFGGDAF
jgi:hypothetical protein